MRCRPTVGPFGFTYLAQIADFHCAESMRWPVALDDGEAFERGAKVLNFEASITHRQSDQATACSSRNDREARVLFEPIRQAQRFSQHGGVILQSPQRSEYVIASIPHFVQTVVKPQTCPSSSVRSYPPRKSCSQASGLGVT